MKKTGYLLKIAIFIMFFTGVYFSGNTKGTSYAGQNFQYTTPQVLIILDNSQSMDGNLSGAIMTGSGIISSDQSSSSPVYYTVPSGFTAPVTGQTSGSAPYTSKIGPRWRTEYVDNSASRLNVAKEAIMQSYNKWQGYAQFGLMDFGISDPPAEYTTWVYYMSGNGGFLFGNSSGAPSGLQAVANPCYEKSSGSCSDIKNLYGSQAVKDEYLYIQDTSDEPSINDVLYAGGLPDNFVTYDGPNPPSPFPPNYSLSDYNYGNILETYYRGTDGTGGFATSPTNAGYVPYSPQVWYSERGFGYYNNVTDNGNLIIPIESSSSTQQGYFSTALAPETNNGETTEIKADAVNAPIAGTLSSALSYLTGAGGYPPLPSSQCAPKKYVILITDGLPTFDQSGLNWPPIGSASATGYGVWATFNADGSLAGTNDAALSGTINEIKQLKKQGIETYVIGMGAGVDPSLNPQAAKVLKAMAVAGGTSDYFPATTPTAVADDLGVIIQSIIYSGSYTAPVVHEYQGSNSNVYYSDFKALNQPLWGEGNIFLFKLDSSGQLTGPQGVAVNALGQVNTGDSYWDSGNGAGGELQNESPSSRYVITSYLDASSGANQTVLLNPVSSQSSDPVVESMLGLTSSNYSSVCPGSASEAGCAADILNFILNPAGSIDNWKLGAIYNSSPVLIGPPSYPYSSTSYQTFKTETTPNMAHRQQILVGGANDGMVHGFDAGTWDNSTNSYGNGTGGEIFGYIPSNFFTQTEQCPSNTSFTLPKITCWYELSLMPSATNFQSYYSYFEFVDSTPYISDVFFNDIFNGTVNTLESSVYPVSNSTPQNSWHTVLVGGERDGGNYYYSLDLTNPANAGSTYPAPLWTINDPGMGNTWSEPFISFVCLPNPYSSNNNNAGICSNNPDPASPVTPPEYVSTYIAVEGGGYSANNSLGNAVYALYVEPNPVKKGSTYTDDQVLWEFNSSNDSNMMYSIPSEVASFLSFGELEAFYVGDLGGQVWSFNIPNGTPPYARNGSSNWTGCRLFVTDVSPSYPSNPLKIFFPPALAYDPAGNLWAYFGTGDINNMQSSVEHKTTGGTTAYNEFVGVEAVPTGTPEVGTCPKQAPYNESNLTNVTGTSETTSSGSSYSINSISTQGWYITLHPGEKVTGTPVVYDGIVYFDTFTPSSSSDNCGTGTVRIYALNYLNGGGTIINGSILTSTTANKATSTAAQYIEYQNVGVPSPLVVANGHLLVSTSENTVYSPQIQSGSMFIPTSWFQYPFVGQ